MKICFADNKLREPIAFGKIAIENSMFDDLNPGPESLIPGRNAKA
jgi:hypothetical protein